MTLHNLSAVEAADRMRRGDLPATDLLESCLAQIDTIDPAVNAMVTRADDRARAEAAHADEIAAAGGTTGPLHGLPVAIKDLQPTAGIRTTYGTPRFADHVPDDDALIVRRVREAGGIVIGKTNIPEMSIGANTVNPVFGATGNPFDVDLSCGGSSGGSAVAVATEMAPLATGSDHGGSLRIPASYCGVVGYRATPGVVPSDLRSVAQTFYSVQGPMARSVADIGLLLSVIAGRDASDPMSFPLDAASFAELEPNDPGTLRIGVSSDLGGLRVSTAIRSLFESRVDLLSGKVGSLDEADIDLRRAPEVDWLVRSDLFVAQYGDSAAAGDEGFNPNIAQTLESAMATDMADIASARRIQLELYREFQAVFETFDVIVCPCVSISPFPWAQRNPPDIDGDPVERYMDWLELTAALTVVGHPVVTLPCGLDHAGMPFGIQVVGRMYDDRRLLDAAAGLETALGSHPETARPRPDMAQLATTVSGCRDHRV